VRLGFIGLTCCFALAMASGTGTARADWQIRRTNDRTLEEQAARALLSRPTDHALARRLVGLAGKAGGAALRARFQARAEAPAASYADVAACATLLMAFGAFDDAAAMFARAIALRPEPAALEGHARALARADRRAEAVLAYDRALAAVTAPTARRRLLEAQVSLLDDRSDGERELSIRRALLELTPRDDGAARRLVDALARAGRAGEAADVLESRLGARRGTATFDDVLRLAELRDAAGEGPRAAAALADLLAHLPLADEERRRLAWARTIIVARHHDGLPALAEGLSRATGPIELSVLGEVRDELGDLEGALEAIRRADRLRPSAELGRRIVALLDRLGRDDEAVAAYEALSRRDPADPRWPLELIERELRRGQRRRAGEHFDRAAARFARVPSATIRLAELAARWGEDRRALAAWERVRRIAPRDEQGILGLGETQFAAGKRAQAIATWQALRSRDPSAVAGHLRLAEVLLEHDLLAEAFASVEQARTLEPKSASVHRLLAQVLERQRQPEAAVREWEAVIELSPGPNRASERREARARILTVLARAGRAKLDQRVRALEEGVRRDGSDWEQVLFLAEAQQRLGNQLGAIATLRALLAREANTGARGGAGPAADGDARAEVTLALVRLLRTAGKPEEAVRLLEELAARTPARAREAHVQIADLQLARHDEALALAHAQEAARLAPGDGQALARIAAIEERAGDESRAAATYRQAFERDGNATAGFALARLLEARGDAAASAAVLRKILRSASDDEAILEAGRRARDVEEYLGRLSELEREVEGAWSTGSGAPVYRRVFVDVLRRLLPRLARDPAASAERARLAQRGLRPVLELVTDADGAPELALVEQLGLLGNKDATPALARLAAPPTDVSRDERDRPPARTAAAREIQAAAVVALGRLGDERGREVLERLALAPDPALRAAAVWALGRLPAPAARGALEHALRDPRSDVAGLACLSLGRASGEAAVSTLSKVATDVERPVIVRRAALAGLALAGSRAAGPTLLALADSGDEVLEREAVRAAGAIRDRRTLLALLERALLGGDEETMRALDSWVSGGALPDEGPALEGSRVDLESVLNALVPAPSGADTAALWREDPRAVGELLNRALAAPGPRRQRALEALDARDDGPGLGPLAPSGRAPMPAPTAVAVRDVATKARESVAKLLDASDPATAATALRILAKLDDPRVTPQRLARAAAGPPAAREAAQSAARRIAATPAYARTFVQALSSELVASHTADERLGIVEVLGALGEAAVGALERAASDRSPLVRAAVARAVAAHRNPLSAPILERLSADESPAVRRAALTRSPALDLSPSPTTMGR
jgi:tetratricopeptide (TPR) repeat protein/HEAT repeat protein